ncbi:MAG: anaerobic ribonucleoside-triphosphate reductase activating protein [Treponemataceae bacterium]|nr:anaerobic ribonucleoside-triphosphate reductase activating protein [Treponemataceae bacterium]
MKELEAAGSKKAGVLVKTSLVDYPGHVSSTVFLHGCNLRCPYCYNTELVIKNINEVEGISTVQEIIEHLEKRKAVLTGFVISGGEALISPYLEILITEAKKRNYKIKLDTNGTNPDKLEAVLKDPELRPDFVAMDIKTSISKLGLLVPHLTNEAINDILAEKVKKTAELVAAMPADTREYRTVLVPPLVDENDIIEMAAFLPKDASWQFAQFRNDNCLDPLYNNVTPYTPAEAEALVKKAASLIPGAELR